ncbi:hypothetical protein AB4114_11290 [Paenibacillus sp. 2RAB27]|uniref:hypothetical protein n=1 Tax=Paenibacillus sp. 2RAB27 TaxID=3232991 RepID=UPI003F993653
MSSHANYMLLLGLYRQLANGEYEVTAEIYALEKELGFRSASLTPAIDSLHRRITALERENTFLSVMGLRGPRS